MQWWRLGLNLLTICMLLFPLITVSETRSKLRMFEEDATLPGKSVQTETHSQHPATSSSGSDHDSGHGEPDLGDKFTSGVVDILVDIITQGGIYSWDRVALNEVDGATEGNSVTPRTLGEKVIPYVRLDMSYDRVSSSIYATSWRAEVGYGPVGFEERRANYYESEPNISLDVRQYHFLYRMSLGDYIEINLGLGEYELTGASRNSGDSSTLHILIHPNERVGIEYRPSWATINGSSISDDELAISYGGRFWAVRGGYHWLESPGSSLNGPFLGFSLWL